MSKDDDTTQTTTQVRRVASALHEAAEAIKQQTKSAPVAPSVSAQTPKAAAPECWWKSRKTVPTLNFRWKRVAPTDYRRPVTLRGLVLQQMHVDPSGGTALVWLDVPIVDEDASDERQWVPEWVPG